MPCPAPYFELGALEGDHSVRCHLDFSFAPNFEEYRNIGSTLYLNLGKLSHFWEGLYCSGHPGDTTSKTSPGFRFSAGSDSDSLHTSGREVAFATAPSAIFLTAILDNGKFGESTEPTLGPAVGCITLIGGVFVVVLTSSCGESSNRLRDPAKSTHCQSQFALSVASHIQEILQTPSYLPSPTPMLWGQALGA